MNNYILDLITAVNTLCNLVVIIYIILLFSNFKEMNDTNMEIHLIYKIIFILSIVGVIFIPSKETLIILLNL